MLSKIAKSLATGCLLLGASCASIFDGTSDEVYFTSDPSGAHVVAGDVEGITPCTLTVSKSLDDVTFDHPSYSDRSVELDSTLQGGFILLDIFFTPGYGLVGLLVDGMTQAWWDLPNAVHCDFTVPVDIAEGDAPEL